MSKQYGFYVDTKRCSGCKACLNACKDRHNLADGEKFRKVFEFSGGTWKEDNFGGQVPEVYTYYVSMACNQCDDPACLAICPGKAYSKRKSDGIVQHDPEKCISCFQCIDACPYNAPTYDYKAEHMKKCEMCTDEATKDGVPKPQCVGACPSRALDFGEIGELRKKYGTANVIATFQNKTKPNLVMSIHNDSKKGNELANKAEIEQV